MVPPSYRKRGDWWWDGSLAKSHTLDLYMAPKCVPVLMERGDRLYSCPRLLSMVRGLDKSYQRLVKCSF